MKKQGITVIGSNPIQSNGWIQSMSNSDMASVDIKILRMS